MKTYFKIFIKSLLILLIALSMSVVFSFLLSPDEKKIKTAFNSIPKNYLDVVVLGSSHTQYGINPAVINNESGLYSYINASACQPMEVSYTMFKETLKTQHPKVVILDVFTMLPASSVCYADSVYKMAADEMTGLEKLETLNMVGDKTTAFNYIFSIRMYHQRWKEVKKEDLLIDFDDKSYDGFGYVNLLSNDLNFRYLEKPEKKNKYILNEKDINALKKIKELAEKNNIELLLIKTPFDIDQKNYDALTAVWDLAKELNIDYIDFIELSKEIDFVFGVDSETWHNTNWGAYKISKYLGNYLKENYHFSHKGNKIIDKNLQSLKSSTLFSLLNNLPDPYAFIKYASEYDCITLIKYQGSNKTSITNSENQLLQSLGSENNFIWNKNLNYYAIIQNGKVLIDGNREVNEIVNGKSIKINDKGIFIDEEMIEDTDGELTVSVYGNDLSWHHNMNIDYASKWFWKVGCDGYKCK